MAMHSDHAYFEEMTGRIQFSDEEYIEDDDDDEGYTLRCKFDDDDQYDADQKTVPRNFRGQRVYRGLGHDTDELEVENRPNPDEVQARNFSVRSIHSGLTDDEYDDERRHGSVSAKDQILLSPAERNLVIHHHYYGVCGVQIGDHSIYLQQANPVSVPTGIYFCVMFVYKKAELSQRCPRDAPWHF